MTKCYTCNTPIAAGAEVLRTMPDDTGASPIAIPFCSEQCRGAWDAWVAKRVPGGAVHAKTAAQLTNCEHGRVEPVGNATWRCVDCGLEADTPDWDNMNLRVGRGPGAQCINPGKWRLGNEAPEWPQQRSEPDSP